MREKWHLSLGLLVQGAGSRLVLAMLIIMALWAGFFWAIGSPGSL